MATHATDEVAESLPEIVDAPNARHVDRAGLLAEVLRKLEDSEAKVADVEAAHVVGQRSVPLTVTTVTPKGVPSEG